jgi:hypothetical protein
MNIIKFVQYRTKVGLYYNIVKADGFLDNLACFLTHEIAGEKDSSWINFLNDSTYQKMSGNEIVLEKKGRDIYIGNLYCEDSDEAYDKLKISISELLGLIKTWEDLLNKEPEEIWFIHNKGKFELIGKNDSKEVYGEVEC